MSTNYTPSNNILYNNLYFIMLFLWTPKVLLQWHIVYQSRFFQKLFIHFSVFSFSVCPSSFWIFFTYFVFYIPFIFLIASFIIFTNIQLATSCSTLSHFKCLRKWPLQKIFYHLLYIVSPIQMFTLLTLTKVYPRLGDEPETNCNCSSHVYACKLWSTKMRSFI